MRIEKNDGSFYFLLKLIEYGSGEEFAEGDIEAVAELLDGRDGRTAVPAVDYVVHRRLCHTADVAQPVYRDVPLIAQLKYPIPHCLANVQ